jgi:hypothetical protein
LAIGPTLTALFPGDLLSVALYYCAGAGMGEDIAVGVVGFLLSSIALGAFTGNRLKICWGPSADSDHPSRSSRRRHHCRPSWVVGNDGGSVFPMLVIVGVKRLYYSRIVSVHTFSQQIPLGLFL